MNIRLAVIEDIPAINTLLKEVLDIHQKLRPDLFIANSKKYTDEEIKQIIENPQTPIFVTVIDQQVVGYVFCIIKENRQTNSIYDNIECYIDDLCVKDAFRGKGIGKKLFEFVEEYAKDKGMDYITLHVWKDNEALNFYESCGLQERKRFLEKKLK